MQELCQQLIYFYGRNSVGTTIFYYLTNLQKYGTIKKIKIATGGDHKWRITMPDNDLDFDFLTPAEPEPTETQEPIGPNLQSVASMTPRKFALSVLAVYQKLGGASWLITEAKADPKSFLDLLKKLIPKSVQLEDLAGLSVTLIDQFGHKMQIKSAGSQPDASPVSATTLREPQKSGQLQIATGGNLSQNPSKDDTERNSSPGLSTSEGQENTPIDIKDIFE